MIRESSPAADHGGADEKAPDEGPSSAILPPAEDHWGSKIADPHQRMLKASGITAAQAHARGYVSIDSGNRFRLKETKIAKAIHKSDGLLIPLLRIDGEIGGYQYRPDNPRVVRGKPQKYESEYQKPTMIDFPPGVAERLAHRDTPVWFTEGVKKGDAGACAGLAIVDLVGTWSWLTGGVALPDFRDIALRDREAILCFDSDVAIKKQVWRAVRDLGEWLRLKGAKVRYCVLPEAL
jgi:hypothetical protein